MEQVERLERNKRDGRLCAMATGRGGCFTRATKVETHESWIYELGQFGTGTVRQMTFCGRHSMEPGYEGRNFRVLKVEKIR